MTTLNRLSLQFLARHPDDAARDVERINSKDLVPFFAAIPTGTAAKILINMTPVHSIEILSALQLSTSISILETVPANVATALVRRMPVKLQKALLELAEREGQLESVRILVKFPANTVGAIMEPQVLILHESMNADEVRHVLKFHLQQLPHEFYVVDQSYRLSGYVSASDLLLKDEFKSLAKLVRSFPHGIAARSRIDSAVANPGWLDRNHLPVVDDDGVLLGDLDRQVLQRAASSLEQQHDNPDASRDIIVGLAETFLNSFTEIMSGNRH